MAYKPGVFLALALLAASSFVHAEDAGSPVPYSAAENLRNFALSVCISDGYQSEEVVKDSRAAAGGYLELGGFPIEAYEEAASLGKKFLAKDYRGKRGEKLTLMKCIDLIHSKELEQIIRKYSKQ